MTTRQRRARSLLTGALLACALSSSPCGSLEQGSLNGLVPASVPSPGVRAADQIAARQRPEQESERRIDDPPPTPALARLLRPDVGRRSTHGRPGRGSTRSARRWCLTYNANAPPRST